MNAPVKTLDAALPLNPTPMVEHRMQRNCHMKKLIVILVLSLNALSQIVHASTATTAQDALLPIMQVADLPLERPIAPKKKKVRIAAARMNDADVDQCVQAILNDPYYEEMKNFLRVYFVETRKVEDELYPETTPPKASTEIVNPWGDIDLGF